MFEAASKDWDFSLAKRSPTSLEQHLGRQPTPQLCEAVTLANGTAYAWERLSEFTDGTYSMDRKVTLTGCYLAVMGFPTNKIVDAAVPQANNNVT